MEDYIDKALSNIEKDLLNQQPPKVVKDPKRNKISVTYDFGLGWIEKVKLIASRENWLKIYNEWDFDHVSFDDIEQYLSRPSKDKKQALKRYAQEYPEPFGSDIRYCVDAALFNNPLFKPATKPRGGSPYGLDWSEKNKISATAVRLYVYLKKVGKKPESKWPRYLNGFLRSYDVPPAALKNDLELHDCIRTVLSKYFQVRFSERFCQTFVVEGPVSLKRIKSLKIIAPEDNSFLLPLFEEFLK